MNKVFLTGRLTANPEKRITANGNEFCCFTVAVNRKNASSQTDFVDCIAGGNIVNYITAYIKKGYLLNIEGALNVSNYQDANGQSRKSVRVNVQGVENLTPKPTPAATPEAPAPVVAPTATPTPVPTSTPIVDFPVSDDDLPF